MDYYYDRSKFMYNIPNTANNYMNYSNDARTLNIGKMLLNPKYSLSPINNSNIYQRSIDTSKFNNTNTLTTTDTNNNNRENISKLPHKLIESTTEDPDHPLRELLRGLKGSGWFSSRFSQFPQEIYIQFAQPVNIRQINMVIHEKNIPAQIKFYTFCPNSKDELIQNYHKVNYKYVGFIKMDTNERSNFRARESRKVYINTNALFFKIQLERNYVNRFNIFNQVGLMNLDFFGFNLKLIGNNERNNNFIIKHAVQNENNDINCDRDLDEVCGDELNELKEKLNYNIKIENYAECKQIKYKLDKVRQYAKQIYDLEKQKKIAVNNEDFDAALDLKNLVDKMKINLKKIFNTNAVNEQISQLGNTNNVFDIENQIVGGNNKLSNIGFNDTLNNNNNSNNNSNILNTTNINESIISNQSISRNMSATHHQKKSEDNFISYDDTILPAVLKKLNNEPENKEEEIGNAEKGELENLSPGILKEYQLIADVIGEIGLQKIFSKQILWKEEGLNIFMEKLDEIIDSKKNDGDPDITNKIITCIMKLSMVLIEEKHPSVVIKTLEILKQLFEYIKEHGTKLNIDLNITDSVLTKIKRKLGDANKKVRQKAVSLYCYMLTLDFCDYNNLIAELLEEELRHYDSKYLPKSPNLIIGKLEIFDSVFDNFESALKSRRTSLDSFPSNLVIEYLILNVGNNKSEVRKLARLVISKFIKIFGVNKIKKKLEKIEERELSKLVNEIPVLQEYFPKLANKNNNSLNNSNLSNKGNNKKNSKEKSPKKINNVNRKKNNSSINKDNKNNKKAINLNNNENKNPEKNIENNDTKSQKSLSHKSLNKIKNKSNDFCDYCQRKMKSNEVLANHWVTDCKMFIRCEKCSMNVEVKDFNNHKLKECKFKNDFKECKNCHEAIPIEEYEKHSKNKCSIKPGYVKCPLCHKDIPDNEKGFFTHLVKEGCPKRK